MHDLYEDIILQALGQRFNINKVSHLSGGCINEVLKLTTDDGDFCLKLNGRDKNHMFETEAKGIGLLAEFGEFTLPKVLGQGVINEKAYLLLSFVSSGMRHKDYWSILAKQLAALHRHTNDGFGLDHNNYIGELPQQNELHHDWISFFIENRLEQQLSLARNNKLIDNDFLKTFRGIYRVFHEEFPTEAPALLHGDLWSGNVSTDQEGMPFLFDPAVYYGHREIELAFTRLFGGFENSFYQAYLEAFPLQPGFEQRVDLYNLYPLLVHLNLFGSSYLNSIRMIIRRFQ